MSPSIETILASDRFPTLPEVAVKVLEIARCPDPDPERLTEVIRLDPAMAGRILKVANSALLGMKTRASSIEQAVPRLGTTMVRTLVLSFSLTEFRDGGAELRQYYQRIWRESLMQAAAAEALAERQHGLVDPPTWFLAGLLQDIGRLTLLQTCRSDYVKEVLNCRDDRSERERERRWLGFDHVDVSVAICRRWNLGSDILDAISVHHASAHRVVPMKFASATSLPAALLTAAHIAEYLEAVSHDLLCSRDQIERMLMQVYACRPNDIFRILSDIDVRTGVLSATFGIDAGLLPSLESILADAQELLGQIALASQLRLVRTPPVVLQRESASVSAPAPVENPSVWRDQLTGAFNRTWLENALESVIAQSLQHDVGVGLLMIEINDKRCRSAEDDRESRDNCRLRVAALLQKCVRLSDSIVRYGDAVFVITLKDVNSDLLTLISDQIGYRIAEECHVESVREGCIIGAAIAEAEHLATLKAQTLIQAAENALQNARRSGRGSSLLSYMNEQWNAPVIA